MISFAENFGDHPADQEADPGLSIGDVQSIKQAILKIAMDGNFLTESASELSDDLTAAFKGLDDQAFQRAEREREAQAELRAQQIANATSNATQEPPKI